MGTKDDNARAQDGTLPDDPTADAVDYRGTPAIDMQACSVGELLPNVLAEIDARNTGKSKPIALPHWPQMAAALGGGLWPGFYTLTGNTGSGKSAFAIDVALQAAQAGCPVLYIALELDELGILARLLAHPRLAKGAFVRWSALYRGQVDGDTLAGLADRSALIDRLPIHIRTGDAYGYDPKRMRADAAAFVDFYGNNAAGPPLVLLDFLQVLSSPKEERWDMRERLSRAAYAGRQLARERGAVVLALSSTARDNYGKLGGQDRTSLGAFNPGALVGLGKESGEIEYASDGVFVLASEPRNEAAPPEGGTPTWLAIAKQRAGLSAWIPMRFDGRSHKEDWGRAPFESHAEKALTQINAHAAAYNPSKGLR